jgi:hypothetical protein
MNSRAYVILHLLAIGLGAAALWWIVFQDRPAEAVADSITAAAVAGYFEIVAMRIFG